VKNCNTRCSAPIRDIHTYQLENKLPRLRIEICVTILAVVNPYKRQNKRQWAMVMTTTCAKNQGKKSVSSKARVVTSKLTDGQTDTTDCSTLPANAVRYNVNGWCLGYWRFGWSCPSCRVHLIFHSIFSLLLASRAPLPPSRWHAVSRNLLLPRRRRRRGRVPDDAVVRRKGGRGVYGLLNESAPPRQIY